jgi:dienelactone hydrolase
MRKAIFLLYFVILAGNALAATDVRVNFVLNTTDSNGVAIQQNRFYLIYRPDNLSKSTPVPMILAMDDGTLLHRKADQAGFVAVSASSSGNSSGTPGTGWNNDNPSINGYEDYDYLTEVINRVKASDNVNDAFTIGFSTGGHTSLAYACVRPSTIRAAASAEEFMGLTSNIPTAPLPVILFQGTLDASVNYTMVKDTVDAWRMVDGLVNTTPVTTYESSRLIPGKVSQATWQGGIGGTQAALVSIVGGTHQLAVPTQQTGYDYTDAAWAFFSQFLTSTQAAPKVVSQPVDNLQVSGQPASFWVAATGDTPLSYQWQQNGADIPGATSNWLTIPSTTSDDNGSQLQAVMTNASGTVTSFPATLTVNAAPDDPAIIMQPADQVVSGGQPVSFVVTAGGTAPITYQWQKNGIDIAGATAASLEIQAANLSDSGASFSAVVRSAAGSGVSNRATLTVTRAAGAPVMLANPARARVLANQTAVFSVTAWSAGPMSYQWQQGSSTGIMTDIPGATNTTYTTPSTKLSDNLTLLRCVVSNPAGTVTSASEILMVAGAPTAPTKVASAITAFAQVGAPFQYTIAFGGGTTPLTYTASPLPVGLSVDAASGVISGIPTETSTFTVAIAAGNPAGHPSALLTLAVTDAPPVVTLNEWRLANFGASAIDPSVAGDDADPDGDGYTNLEEFTFGSNPLDSSSVPAVPANGSDPKHGMRRPQHLRRTN